MGRSKKTWDQLVDYQGNYAIDIQNGIWPGSGQAPSVKGDPGQKGDTGSNGAGATGSKGQKGLEGDKGLKGEPGRRGLSLKGQKGDNEKGQKGDDGQPGPYGDKGEIGFKGDKGDVQNLLHFQGQLPTIPDLPPYGNGQIPGDVWQIVADDTFWVWDGTQWVKLSEALDVLKGEKGDSLVGPKGEKGETALDGLDGTDGVDGNQGEKGDKGEEADKGEKGDEGDKGEKGDLGPSNYELYFDSTLDNPKLSELEYLESLKGQKGDSGIDNSVLDNYYDKGEVDYLLDQYPDPPDSYDINYMDDSSVILPPGLVDFNTTDHNDRIYNKGMVTILPGCTIVNSPAPNTPLLLLNWVMADTTGLRDVDYTLIQFLFNADDQSVTEGGFYRRCTPGLSRFSPWAAVGTGGGSLDDYYTKQESDDRFALAPHIDPNFALMTEAGEHFLRLFTAGSTVGSINDLGNVKLIEGPGIKVENVNGELKLSTTNEPLYLGTLEFDEDPQVEFDTRPEHDQKTLQNGNFFIYSSEGLAVGVEPPGSLAQSSDFCVYEEATTSWKIVKRESSGIQSVTTDRHGVLETLETLSIDNSDPKALSIKTTDQVVVQRQLLAHPRWGPLVELESRRKIGSLADVTLPYAVDNPDAINKNAGYGNWLDFAEIPSNDGEISVDVSARLLKVHFKGNAGVDNNWLANAFGDDQYFLQAEFDDIKVVASVSSVGKLGTYFEFRLDEDGAALIANLAKITLLAGAGLPTPTAVFNRVIPVAENGDLLIYNSATKEWEAAPVTQIGDFVLKEGDTMEEDAVHCWPGSDYVDTEMCISHGLIDASKSYSLQDRAGLQVELTCGGQPRPLALTSGSSYGDIMAVYTYEAGAQTSRGKRYSLDANGSVYSNGSLWLDLKSATQFPAPGLALRMDLDGTTRINYNSSNDALTISDSLLRLNFAAGSPSNLVETKVDGVLKLALSPAGKVILSTDVEVQPDSNVGNFHTIRTVQPYNNDGNAFGLQLKLNGGNTVNNTFQIVTRDDRVAVKINDSGSPLLKIEGRTTFWPDAASTGSQVIFQTKKSNGDSTFIVTGNGKVSAGANSSKAFIATSDEHVVTKKHLDNTINFNSYPELV